MRRISVEEYRNRHECEKDCEACKGKGYYYAARFENLFRQRIIFPVYKRCQYCNGSGKVDMTDEEISEEIQLGIESQEEHP